MLSLTIDMFTHLFEQIEVVGHCALDVGHSIVSFAAAPTLLLYSYIPAIIIALVLSFIVFFADKRKSLSRAFIVFTSTYAFGVINIILQWILVSNKALFIFWHLTALLKLVCMLQP